LVPRQLSGARALGAALALVVIALAGLAPVAQAANRRVAIGNYQWSSPLIHLDLGEHVTWYWVGPDTIHSVTGTSANDTGLDSDPNSSIPDHKVGDRFQLTFSHPGTYTFQCKLHSTVRGTVDVSSTPGDPTTEPDPIPKSNLDLVAPYIDDVALGSRAFGSGGTRLRYGADERASADAEYYRLVKRHGRHGKPRRDYAGWQRWHGSVGLNQVRIADHSRHFRPRPGRYRAVVRFTDAANNTAPVRRLRFRVRG
jgi:plastocyanin